MTDALSNAFAGIRDAAANFEAAAGRVAASGAARVEAVSQAPQAASSAAPAAVPAEAPSTAGQSQGIQPSAAAVQLQENANSTSNLASDVVDLKKAETAYKANTVVAAAVAETEAEVLDTLS